MNKQLTTFILFYILAAPVAGQYYLPQEDRLKEEVKFAPGLYLTFEDFKNNNPIDPYSIETSHDPARRGFYSNIIRERKLTIKKYYKTIKPSDLWGYSDGTDVFINRDLFPRNILNGQEVTKLQFIKLSIAGRLSYIYYMKTLETSASTGNIFMRQRKSKPSEIIFDTRDGTFHKSKLNTVFELISDDPELQLKYMEYKGDKTVKLHKFLRMYNERKPL